MSMSRVVLKVFFLAIVFAMLTGCTPMDFPPKWTLGSNWVSREGKSQEQLYRDQTECKRDIMVVSPPGFSAQNGAGGSDWDTGSIKQFESCMRAKGWVKE
jgi:hypothetical protein